MDETTDLTRAIPAAVLYPKRPQTSIMPLASADILIKALALMRHPEGGWYRETYRSSEQLPHHSLPSHFNGPRTCCTAIHFLLQRGEISALHRIKSDEIWHFHTGASLLIHTLTVAGEYTRIRLGAALETGDVFQAVVPAGVWFGAELAAGGDYALVSCTVSPGFDFADFELGDRSLLLQQYPQYTALVTRLTTETTQSPATPAAEAAVARPCDPDQRF